MMLRGTIPRKFCEIKSETLEVMIPLGASKALPSSYLSLAFLK
jgi:hypothetical protein